MDQVKCLLIVVDSLHFEHNHSQNVQSIVELHPYQRERLIPHPHCAVCEHTNKQLLSTIILLNYLFHTSRALDSTNPMKPREHPREVMFEADP